MSPITQMTTLTLVRAQRQAGFGLVEILIALALGLVIILGVTQLFSTGSRTMSDLEESGQLIENSVFSAEMLARDLSFIGYWGEADVPDTVGSSLGPPLIAPGEIIESTSDFSVDLAKLPPSACLGTAASDFYSIGATPTTSQRSFLELAFGVVEYPFYSSNGGALVAEIGTGKACGDELPSPRVTSDFVAVRRASSCAVGEIGCNSVQTGMFYLQHQGCNTSLTAGDFRLSNTVADLSYQNYDCLSGELAPIYQYVSRVYYVDTDDFLVKLEMTSDASGIQYEAQRLVAGVELLRFQWGIDTDGDGVADEVKAAHSSTDPWSASDWVNAVSVTVWLVIRSPQEIKGISQPESLTVAGDSYPISTTDKYARVVQTRTVDIANISGRRQ